MEISPKYDPRRALTERVSFSATAPQRFRKTIEG